jgi:hypothetical protein
MDSENLHLARHYLRRAHEEAARTNADDLDLIATAHEEICELKSRLDLISLLCHFTENDFCDGAKVPIICVIGAAIGSSNPVVLNFKASLARGEKPKYPENNIAAILKSCLE